MKEHRFHRKCMRAVEKDRVSTNNWRSRSNDVIDRAQHTVRSRLHTTFNTMDIERLIAAVYQESPLWDKRNKLHANRMVVDKCWKTISQDMDIEGEFYSEFEN